MYFPLSKLHPQTPVWDSALITDLDVLIGCCRALEPRLPGLASCPHPPTLVLLLSGWSEEQAAFPLLKKVTHWRSKVWVLRGCLRSQFLTTRWSRSSLALFSQHQLTIGAIQTHTDTYMYIFHVDANICPLV